VSTSPRPIVWVPYSPRPNTSLYQRVLLIIVELTLIIVERSALSAGLENPFCYLRMVRPLPSCDASGYPLAPRKKLCMQ
jgi:hypothetical protein